MARSGRAAHAVDAVVVQEATSFVGEACRRMLQLGCAALTEAELVSVLTGSRAQKAQLLLSGGLRALLHQPLDVLIGQYGLSTHNSARLLAAAELSRRLQKSLEKRPRLNSAGAIYKWVRGCMQTLPREEFHVLCLNGRGVLVRHARVAQGSVDQCHVDVREALAPAVVTRATGIVLLHNHPAGNPEPSTEDVALTRRLCAAAQLLCVHFVDHLVIGASSYVSMRARGLLPEGDSLT